MIIVDTNVLVYVASQPSPHHKVALRWWTDTLAGDETIGLCWQVLVGFARIMTSAKILPQPISMTDCIRCIDSWLAHPRIALIQITQEHWEQLREVLTTSQIQGNLTNDAHLAALAIARGATMVSFDADFSRFKRLKWQNPLAS